MEANNEAIANAVPFKAFHKHPMDKMSRPSYTSDSLTTTRFSHTSGFNGRKPILQFQPLTGKPLARTINQPYTQGKKFSKKSLHINSIQNMYDKHLKKSTTSIVGLSGKAQGIPLSKTLHTLHECKTKIVVDSSKDNATVPQVRAHKIKSLLTTRIKCSMNLLLFNTVNYFAS